jgi:hypothetical protein
MEIVKDWSYFISDFSLRARSASMRNLETRACFLLIESKVIHNEARI